MDPVVAQLFAQMAEMQKKLADGLQATNQNLAALVANSERRQETILREAREEGAALGRRRKVSELQGVCGALWRLGRVE